MELGVLDVLNSPQVLANDLDRFLPQILDIFDTRTSELLHVVTTLLGPVFDEVHAKGAEPSLLQPLLPRMRQVFTRNLTQIRNKINTSEDGDQEVAISINSSLQICVDVLNGFHTLLEHITPLKEVKAEKIHCLNVELPLLLLAAFTHCRDSEGLYKSFFSITSELLTLFFRKSYQLQTKYYRALEDVIVFEPSYEADLSALCDLLETMSVTSEVVVGLDLKTSVEQWKCYTKLASKHSAHLWDRLDVDKPLSSLSSAVKKAISSALRTDSNEKDKLKSMKIGNFLLKVMIKLCEVYKKYLSSCLPDLFNLLLVLYSCTSSLSPGELKTELNRQIRFGSGPLLSMLMTEEAFLDVVKVSISRFSDFLRNEKIGLFHLIIALMKRLAQSRTSARMEDLMEHLIDVYDDCGLELDMSDSDVDGVDGYTSLITTSALFIITMPPDSFPKIQRHSVLRLVQCRVHCALFISDLLCLICRLANEEFRRDLALFLAKFLARWSRTGNHPECAIVEVLLQRVSRLLLPNSRSVLAGHLPEPEPNTCEDLNRSLSLLKNRPSLESYNVFLTCLVTLSSATMVNNSAIDAAIDLIRFHAGCTPTDPCDLWDPILYHALSILSKTRIPDSKLSQVMESLNGVVKRCGPLGKFSIINFLKSIASPVSSIDLMTRLLSDSDPFIEQKALQLYASFDDVISQQIYTDNPNLQPKITSYFDLEPLHSSSVAHWLSSVQHLKFTHKCLRPQLGVRPVKKPKLDLEITQTEILYRIREDIKRFKESSTALSDPTKQLLASVIRDVEQCKSMI